MGLCLGVGVYGFYMAQMRPPGVFEALAESTALGTFGDFEWEILYYTIRKFDIVPYPTHEDFQFMVEQPYNDFNQTVVFVEVTRDELRSVVLKQFELGKAPNQLLIVFETKIIYFQDVENTDLATPRFYYWSPI